MSFDSISIDKQQAVDQSTIDQDNNQCANNSSVNDDSYTSPHAYSVNKPANNYLHGAAVESAQSSNPLNDSYNTSQLDNNVTSRTDNCNNELTENTNLSTNTSQFSRASDGNFTSYTSNNSGTNNSRRSNQLRNKSNLGRPRGCRGGVNKRSNLTNGTFTNYQNSPQRRRAFGGPNANNKSGTGNSKYQNYPSTEDKADTTSESSENIPSTTMSNYKPVATTAPTSQAANTSETLVIPKVPICLFVNNLPKDYTNEQLKALFEQYGPVEDVSFIEKPESTDVASAHVTMKSLADADVAISAISEKTCIENGLPPVKITYAIGEIEKFGIPPEDAVPGVSETRLFIGSLTKHANEQNILSMFSTICHVQETYVIRECGTGQSRGCAFVVLATKEAAIHAIHCLNKSEQPFASRPLEIRFASIKKQNNNEPAVSSMNVAHPITGGNQTTVSSELVNANPRRKDIWVEYFTEDGKPYYFNSALNITQWEKPADFDTPGPPGANLFIFHVPTEWTLRELLYYFQGFGVITSASIATDKYTGRNRGYAFVSYTDIVAAVQAVKAMHGFSTGSKRLKVAIKQNEEVYANYLLRSHDSAVPPQGVMHNYPHAVDKIPANPYPTKHMHGIPPYDHSMNAQPINPSGYPVPSAHDVPHDMYNVGNPPMMMGAAAAGAAGSGEHNHDLYPAAAANRPPYNAPYSDPYAMPYNGVPAQNINQMYNKDYYVPPMYQSRMTNTTDTSIQ